MKKYWIELFLIALLYPGCLKSTQPSQDQSGKTINATYHPNQKFAFELNLNADAGYQWYYVISDSDVAKIDSVHFRPYSGRADQIGGLTIETFYCTAIRTGVCTFALRELRGWEINIPPIDSMRYVLLVR
ncbi:MAG TPA: protease inhibitor I42 family protein [Candidatus Acidoferrales bacterium]|nr:protease inhibitor I42 family protein [Candidatus Acidoferrales bacterium]